MKYSDKLLVDFLFGVSGYVTLWVSKVENVSFFFSRASGVALGKARPFCLSLVQTEILTNWIALKFGRFSSPELTPDFSSNRA